MARLAVNSDGLGMVPARATQKTAAAVTAGTGPRAATGGTINTGQILQSQGATWDASTVPFITTPAKHSGFASGQVLNDNTSAENFFQTTSYIANTGTAPVIGLGGFGVGFQSWGQNLLGAAIGKNATTIGCEIDVGCYPSHMTCTFTNTSDTLTSIVVDRAGSLFSVGDTLSSGFGGFPAGATILTVNGPANAPTSIQMSAPATSSGSLVSVSSVATGQTATGLVIVGEGTNIGGPGNASGVGVQIQANTTGVGSGFGTGFRISSSGLAATNGVGYYMTGVSSTNGIGVYLNGCTLASGFNITNGNYTRGIFLNAITATSGLDFGSSTLTQAINMSGITGIGIKWPAGFTGAGSAALGANCPAVTVTAPFTWIKCSASDGSVVYIPAWK